ncbi:hypothetical protein [Arenimonas daejeonensis]|uniref:hypothetical protein n=1 Tax=Arenimonas daejeonensis TaxID=370777 RepID=UPI0013151135|nr:hypothetical protein [Arenimonas daejeonensis]
MTGFLIGALLLCALALAFVLPPLWRDARGSALALVLALPLGAAGLYALLGTPDALDPKMSKPRPRSRTPSPSSNAAWKTNPAASRAGCCWPAAAWRSSSGSRRATPSPRRRPCCRTNPT